MAMVQRQKVLGTGMKNGSTKFRSNLVKSEEFSELFKRVMNSYLNGMLTNQEVIDELLKLAHQIQAAKQLGNDLGLTEEEQAFYDALTRPRAIKDFYENSELVANIIQYLRQSIEGKYFMEKKGEKQERY